MKKFILLAILVAITTSCFAQLPNLAGHKATIKQLISSYGKYNVESGYLLDVDSWDDNDNIYINSEISGSTMNFRFRISSNSRGIITTVIYIYDSMQEAHFNYLKETVIKMNRAKYYASQSNIDLYESNLLNMTRYISFEREINGKTYIGFVYNE